MNNNVGSFTLGVIFNIFITLLSMQVIQQIAQNFKGDGIIALGGLIYTPIVVAVFSILAILALKKRKNLLFSKDFFIGASFAGILWAILLLYFQFRH